VAKNASEHLFVKLQRRTTFIIIIALFAIMKHQRIQNHLSRSALLQISQIENIFTNFSYNQNIPQNNKIFFDAQKSSGQSKNEKKVLSPD